MPWKETTPVAERMQCLVDYRSGLFTVNCLAERHGVSRKTLYKWIERFELEGVVGLENRLRRPRRHPNQTPEEIEGAIAEFRRKHPDWGPKKIVHVLSTRDEETSWPARSTVAAILKRHGLVKGRRRRRPVGHPGRPMTVAQEANALWATDFKGEFLTSDGIYCYPLTVTDLYSRYLVGCKGLTERLAREDASHAQAGDDPASFAQPGPTAETLRRVSTRVQYRAASRKHRHETAGGSLPFLGAHVSVRATAHRVPPATSRSGASVETGPGTAAALRAAPLRAQRGAISSISTARLLRGNC
jgi:transposase InsO family protein